MKARILGRIATIGIIGLAYVGLPLTIVFARSAPKATRTDIDKKKINDAINSLLNIRHVRDSTLGNNNFPAAEDYESLAHVDWGLKELSKWRYQKQWAA